MSLLHSAYPNIAQFFFGNPYNVIQTVYQKGVTEKGGQENIQVFLLCDKPHALNKYTDKLFVLKLVKVENVAILFQSNINTLCADSDMRKEFIIKA